MIRRIRIKTKTREEFVDITRLVEGAVAEIGVSGGVCFIYAPHTTAGITINEGADPSVREDMISTLRRLVPENPAYRHAEGNSDAHVKASIMGSTASAPIDGGRLMLGTWQALYFCEFDGPRDRTVVIKVLGG